MSQDPLAQRTEMVVPITNPTGLHARPAVKLTQLVARFSGAQVQVRTTSTDWVPARSVAKVMKLKAVQGDLLHVQASGDEAAQALAALKDLIVRDFDEEPETGGHTKPNNADVPVTSPLAPDLASVEKGVEVMLQGEVASEGVALGEVYVLRPPTQQSSAHAHTPEAEVAAFNQALKTAQAELAALSADAEVLVQEIIGFQQALIADEAFIEPVRQAISGGVSAARAWEEQLAQELQAYAQADSYMQARATDLQDITMRVLRLLSASANDHPSVPEHAIIFSEELTPSQFLELSARHVAAIVLQHGNKNAHVAMLARSQGVPMLIGCKELVLSSGLADKLVGKTAALITDQKSVWLNPSEARKAQYHGHKQAKQAQAEALESYLSRPAQTAKGKRIAVMINVDNLAALKHVNPEHTDGIGLVRTELLLSSSELTDETGQYARYCELLNWAKGRPVTVRTLDAGGDKPLAGITLNEKNPFLGVRGVRLSLRYPQLFKVQLRALARAAVHGPLKVMIPMVSIAAELEKVHTLFQAEVAALNAEGHRAQMPQLGMMVEVPAAALGITTFNADFFSIGSNDLIQYTMAASRDHAELAYLHGVREGVLELITRVADHAAHTQREASLCGEMAADISALPSLLACGLTTLSVPVSKLAEIKAALAAL